MLQSSSDPSQSLAIAALTISLRLSLIGAVCWATQAKGLIEYDSPKEVVPELPSAKYSGLIQQSFSGHDQL